MGTVVHAPRLAWDGARMLVQAAYADTTFAWMLDRLGPVWPPELAESYADTRLHLRYPDHGNVENVEAGLWRVRLEQLIQTRPGVTGPLGALIAEVRQAQAISWPK